MKNELCLCGGRVAPCHMQSMVKMTRLDLLIHVAEPLWLVLSKAHPAKGDGGEPYWMKASGLSENVVGRVVQGPTCPNEKEYPRLAVFQ